MYSRGYEKDSLLRLAHVMNCGPGPSCSKGDNSSLLGSSPFMVNEVRRSRKNARVSGDAARGGGKENFPHLSHSRLLSRSALT